jgi:hypothetical protein
MQISLVTIHRLAIVLNKKPPEGGFRVSWHLRGLSQVKVNTSFYFVGLIANDSQPRKTAIKITVNNFGVFEKVSLVGRIKYNANAILITIPKKPAYFEIASLASCGVGKNILFILSEIRGLNSALL